ncbi:uncharacterized protein LOC127753777 [Oryza glaberrima]|uniref:uncharacterized protein LOC127753777 n=1 Tax=Oryza glaberrima TaxID=4538 RepID=UPI00224C2496|nr:uncharacterized protein LOC127753777 [Oryza glaberrima]
MPVTPPKLEVDGVEDRPEESQTYHIVELENPGDSVCVQLLFRETDLYLVAFRPLDRNKDKPPNSADGWFHFKKEEEEEEEAIIPSFLNSHEIYYSYGYSDVPRYRVGTGCLRDIYYCLRQYTPANAKYPTAQRRRALMVCCLMLAETQRFMQMQREVVENIDENEQAKSIAHLDGLIHDWGVESHRRESAADRHPHPHPHPHGVAPAPAAPAPTSAQVVVDYGLWVLKYSDGYVLPLIMRQQQQYPLPPRQQKQQLRRLLLQQRLRQLRQWHHQQHQHAV